MDKDTHTVLPECCNECRELDGFQGAKGCGDRGCICHVLTELIEKMEKKREPYCRCKCDETKNTLAYNTAITRCIEIVKQAREGLKAHEKEI